MAIAKGIVDNRDLEGDPAPRPPSELPVTVKKLMHDKMDEALDAYERGEPFIIRRGCSLDGGSHSIRVTVQVEGVWL